MDKPRQDILERSSMVVTESFVEARFFMDLPAFGRKICAKTARATFLVELPEIVENSFLLSQSDQKRIYQHVLVCEDAHALRDQLPGLGIVRFAADTSVLPHASGIDPSPLEKGNVLPFKTPENLNIKVTVPNRGKLTGLGIPPPGYPNSGGRLPR